MTEKQEYWSAIIEQWSASGMTQVEYCKKNDIKLKSFYTWKWQLNNKDKPKAEANPVPPKFVALALDEKVRDSSTITITVHGADIHYRKDTNDTLFLELVKLLKETA